MNNDSEPEEAQENAPEEAKEAAPEPVQENAPKAEKVTQPPPPPPQNAAEKFREQVQSTQETDDDYEPEEELWEGGYSAKDLVGTWVMLALGSVALLILPLFIEFLALKVSVVLIVVGWLVGAVLYGWRRFSVHYELTSQRFIHQTGILTRNTDRIEVIDIDDVSFTQGPVQRMLGVGRITITSSDRSHPLLHMIGIADVKSVAGLIDDVRRKERRRRSLHIEAI